MSRSRGVDCVGNGALCVADMAVAVRNDRVHASDDRTSQSGDERIIERTVFAFACEDQLRLLAAVDRSAGGGDTARRSTGMERVR